MSNSEFANNDISATSSIEYAEVMQLSTPGATCDTFKVRLYGKLHFLKRPHNIHDTRLQNAFKKEFELGFNLDHPGIVKYAFFDNESYSIFSEWIEGKTLSQFIAECPDYFNSIKNIDRFLAQLTDAVKYLHSRQIIHLDLKPDNIMITDVDSSVKIIDLGFAINDCFDSTPGCTPQFAAPEQLIAEAKIDCRADIYAIGRITDYIFDHSELKRPKRYSRFISNCTANDAYDRPSSIIQAQEVLKPNHRRLIVFPIILASIIIAIGGAVLFYTPENSQSSQSIITPENILSINTPATLPTDSSDSSKTTEPEPPISTPKINNKPPKLTPAEKLYKAEEEMGMFVAIKGHYELKKEWYDLQYHLFDSLRTEYLKTDESQRLGSHLSLMLRDFIKDNKNTIAKKFPDVDAQTIVSTGHDIERVIIYLCYSDTLLFTDTDKMNQIFYEYAHKKAQLLSE